MALPRLNEGDFKTLSGSAPIASGRLRALGCYLLQLPLWLLAAVYGGYALERAGLYPGRWLFFAFLALAVVLPLLPIFRMRRHFRQPILDAIATHLKLDYDSHDFTPLAYEQARPLLFGEVGDAVFTDRLARSEEKREVMIGQAALRSSGGETLFEGAIYAFERAEGMSGTTVVTPPRPAPPRGDLEPVPFDDDPAFTAAYSVYSTRPDFARKQLDTELRAVLIKLAIDGPFYLYYDTGHVFAAGGAPFASDSIAGSPPAERFRALFDNVAAAFRTLAALNAKLG